MQLLPKELSVRFQEVGSQKHITNPIVLAKYFNPSGVGTWYATEYTPDDNVFFGYVSIIGDDFNEWGYFSLQELEEFVGPFGLSIERDLYCGEFPISKVLHKKTAVGCGCFE